jgi:hypothetical protein
MTQTKPIYALQAINISENAYRRSNSAKLEHSSCPNDEPLKKVSKSTTQAHEPK